MVEAFVGLVGGGKSFNSVRRMMSYMALGGRCCSNILLTGWDDKEGDLSIDSPVRDYLRSLGWEYQPRQYVYISFDEMVTDFEWIKKVPAGPDRKHRTLLVIDEATDLFDTLDGGRLRSNSDYREMFHFLRLSRHVHVDVLFIAQDIDSINHRLRGLVSGIWRSTDMKNFRLPVIKVKFPFDLFLLQLFDRTGKYETRREWLRKDTRIFGLYESEAFNQSLSVKWDGVAVGDGTLKEEKRKMNLLERLLLVLSLALGVWACVASSRSPRVVHVPPSVLSNRLERVSRVSVADSDTNSYPLVVRDSFRYYPAISNNAPYVLFGDRVIKLGVPCEWGVPAFLSSDAVWGMCFDDKRKFHLVPVDSPRPSSSAPVFIRLYSQDGKGVIK